MRIAIIGAGLAGLRLAERLRGHAEVTVFEKSRGCGGRMSTRRAGGFAFDHGAQFFTARAKSFQDFLSPHVSNGTVRQWQARLTDLTGNASPVWDTPHFVAVPGMNALAKAMTEGLTVQRERRVASVHAIGTGWQLAFAGGDVSGPFDWVISTAPAEQSAALMPQTAGFSRALRDAKMHGCYCMMLGYDAAPVLDWDVAIPRTGPLRWIAANHSKPGRPGTVSFVCHSDNEWADAHLEDDQETVKHRLCEAFETLTGIAVGDAVYTSLHRWRYAKTAKPANAPFMIDCARKLAAAGDWCGSGRVETAFESAEALADAVLKEVRDASITL
ncbi:MAG: FAD-dependent oxidoreductase [Pseudomonadota bacterium]